VPHQTAQSKNNAALILGEDLDGAQEIDDEYDDGYRNCLKPGMLTLQRFLSNERLSGL
jgi:hypothetical protein